ncbi:hypothetical protein PIB30_087549 [Stylosanthes scabra]|uniref:Uncharacterized protein n=1 Tax=Stylosanthes scabra TaxID=79078 RepID=A0ABU6ZS62_9FABA|nr:hypothetical protein [Stylosanthes scabra]
MSDNGNPPTIQKLFNLLIEIQADNWNIREELQQLRNRPKDANLNCSDPEQKDDDNANNDEQVIGKKRNNPLSEEIMTFQMPANFTLPTTLKAYDGIGDPDVHVTKFQNMMLLDGASDPFFGWSCTSLVFFFAYRINLFLSRVGRSVHKPLRSFCHLSTRLRLFEHNKTRTKRKSSRIYNQVQESGHGNPQPQCRCPLTCLKEWTKARKVLGNHSSKQTKDPG